MNKWHKTGKHRILVLGRKVRCYNKRLFLAKIIDLQLINLIYSCLTGQDILSYLWQKVCFKSE